MKSLNPPDDPRSAWALHVVMSFRLLLRLDERVAALSGFHPAVFVLRLGRPETKRAYRLRSLSLAIQKHRCLTAPDHTVGRFACGFNMVGRFATVIAFKSKSLTGSGDQRREHHLLPPVGLRAGARATAHRFEDV